MERELHDLPKQRADGEHQLNCLSKTLAIGPPEVNDDGEPNH